MLIDKMGNLVHVYRKHFLYETDFLWASPGKGFDTVEIESIGKVNFLILIKKGGNRYMYGLKFRLL